MSIAQNSIDRNAAERRGTPPLPERGQTPRETGAWMRQEGGRVLDDAIRSIDQAWDMAAADPGSARRLEQLRQEAAGAKAELDRDIAAAEADPSIDAEAGAPEQAEAAEAAQTAEAMLAKTEGYFGDLEALAEMAATGGEKRDAILKTLKERLGNRAAEILDSPEFRRDLAEMRERLCGRLDGENGPLIAKDLTIGQLLAIRETIGSDPERLLRALDVKKRLETSGSPVKANYSEEGALIRVYDPVIDQESGELTSGVTVNFLLEVEPDEAVLVQRVFHREVERGPDGQPRVRKSAEHTIFELPESIKANGLAADITRDSLAEYDAQGVDTIKLHADIDMGGYAWAVYGYGWDKKEMAKRLLEEKEGGEREVESGGVRKKYKDLSVQERRVVVDEQVDSLNAEAVAEVIRKGRANLEKVLRGAGQAGADRLLLEFDELIRNELTVTPATLAEFGRKGPKLFLDTRAPETWHTAESLTEAVRAGKVSETNAADIRKKAYHAGKIVLRDSNWFGKIDLKQDGPQGGVNRKMLEQYLNKSSK